MAKYSISQYNPRKYQVAAASPVIVRNVEHGGSTQTNFVLPLFIHKEPNIGDDTGRDVYMDNNCAPDFSDLVFKDGDDNVLESYLHSKGNYGFIQTEFRAGNVNLVDAAGNIFTSRLTDPALVNSFSKIYKSSDNGVTWLEMWSAPALESVFPIFIDSSGYIYLTAGKVGETYGLYRSIDGGNNFSLVSDFTAVSGTILTFGFDEAPDGSLYFGRYQDAFDCRIFKSTDDGTNWVEVFFDATLQHVHGLRVDQVTGYIYAGCDATPFPIVRSIDSGANWTRIFEGSGGNSTGIICGSGFRLFGAENPRGVAILRTTDDITFTNVLQTDYTIGSLRYIDGVCYAFGETFNRMRYPAIFRSTDDGG